MATASRIPSARYGMGDVLHAPKWPIQPGKPVRQALERFNLPHFFLVRGAGSELPPVCDVTRSRTRHRHGPAGWRSRSFATDASDHLGNLALGDDRALEPAHKT